MMAAVRFGRACLVSSEDEITHRDLFSLREVANDARNGTAEPIVLVLVIPESVALRGESLCDTFADTMRLLATECELYLAIEEAVLRDKVASRFASSRRLLSTSNRLTVVDTLDEAFRRARAVAPSDILEIQRLHRRTAPPTDGFRADISTSGTHPIAARQK